MLFLYILAFFTLSNGFCWVCLELIDMREARRKGQNATWYKAARVGIGHLLYALSLLLFGKYILNLFTASVVYFILTFMVIIPIGFTIELYVRLKPTKNEPN
jgi:hypothetical protein